MEATRGPVIQWIIEHNISLKQKIDCRTSCYKDFCSKVISILGKVISNKWFNEFKIRKTIISTQK